jgi:hypothetical protein
MIRDPECLAEYVKGKLENNETCRVFCDTLQECWNLPEEKQAEAIRTFAHAHGWRVKIHEPRAYGVVADFRRAAPEAIVEPIQRAVLEKENPGTPSSGLSNCAQQKHT